MSLAAKKKAVGKAAGESLRAQHRGVLIERDGFDRGKREERPSPPVGREPQWIFSPAQVLYRGCAAQRLVVWDKVQG